LLRLPFIIPAHGRATENVARRVQAASVPAAAVVATFTRRAVRVQGRDAWG
jgi:hypothetical protein